MEGGEGRKGKKGKKGKKIKTYPYNNMLRQLIDSHLFRAELQRCLQLVAQRGNVALNVLQHRLEQIAAALLLLVYGVVLVGGAPHKVGQVRRA